MNERKMRRLVAAMVRVKNLCAELRLPDPISLDAQRAVLQAADAQDEEQLRDFMDSLAPKPLTSSVQ
jgi:hypothetical protein